VLLKIIKIKTSKILLIFRNNLTYLYWLHSVEFLIWSFEIIVCRTQDEMGLLRSNLANLRYDSFLNAILLLLDRLHRNLFFTEYDMRLAKCNYTFVEFLLIFMLRECFSWVPLILFIVVCAHHFNVCFSKVMMMCTHLSFLSFLLMVNIRLDRFLCVCLLSHR